MVRCCSGWLDAGGSEPRFRHVKMIVIHPATGQRCLVDFEQIMAAARSLAADGLDIESMEMGAALSMALLRLERDRKAA